MKYNYYGAIVDTENKTVTTVGKIVIPFSEMDEIATHYKGANRIHKPFLLLFYTDMKNGKLSNWKGEYKKV